MPSLNPNSKYQTYNIAPTELVESHFLAPAQRAHLQNQLVDVIEQKLALSATLTPEGKESYWQQEAYLRGQIDFINYLLECSDRVEEQVREQAHQSPVPSDSSPI